MRTRTAQPGPRERAGGFARLAIVGAILLPGCGPRPDWSPPPSAADVDVGSLLLARTPTELAGRRAELRRLLWGGHGLPRMRQPDRIHRDVRSESFADLANLLRIDAFEISMDHGVTSVVYDFRPERGDGRVLLYHQGHRGGFDLGRATIAAFLADGCRVLAFSPPLLGRNSRPTTRLADGRSVRLEHHDQLFELELGERHALSFFIEPVIVALNALDAEPASNVGMVGVSGGGWTTVLAAAIDERIRVSYPVAATLPMHLRTERDFGDLEQTHPDLLAILGFPELYVLGAAGPGRRQLQVFNEFDPQVFGGRRHELYERPVRERAEALGGAFAVHLDSANREHSLGPEALDRLVEDFRSPSPAP